MGADDEKADEMPKVSGTGVPKASEEAPASDAPTEEEKREIEEAARNIEEHAKIDDPVEPPARNAPKNIKAAGTDDNNVDAALAFIPSTSKSILSRLFDPDRVQKKELWEHIKLVAPGPADQPPPGLIKWRTKDAVSAYCLKCRKQFTYTKGTSKTISRHMQAYHGLIEKETPTTTRTGKRSSLGSTNAPPLKKRKHEFEQSSAQGLLLKWIVSSFQPWSVVESSGIKDFVGCLSDSFELPTTEGIIQIAMDHVEKVKLEIRRVLKDAESYSLVCQTFQNQDKWYTSVTVIFCASSFERKSVCLGVLSGKATKETVTSLLNDYSLSLSAISHVTVSGVSDSIDLGLDDSSTCVLYKMDSIVQEACSSEGLVDSVVAEALKAAGSKMGTTSFVCRTYAALQALENTEASANWKPDKGQKLIISVLTAFLKPFYDAHQTLSGEAYSTVGLAIPVARRINDVLTKLDVKALTKGSKEAPAVSSTKGFCSTLSKAFSSAFASILGKDPPDMWTIPIDPRLIHMGGLSDKEKEAVTASLIEKVSEKKLAAREGEVTTQAAASTSESGPKSNKKAGESSTMGGIFWGDDSGDQGKADDQTKAAAVYARSNVDHYFTTVKSRSRIEDPLAWWNTNQKEFPELGELARVWLGATVVGPAADERCRYPEGEIELMAFLHDNADMILGV